MVFWGEGEKEKEEGSDRIRRGMWKELEGSGGRGKKRECPL